MAIIFKQALVQLINGQTLALKTLNERAIGITQSTCNTQWQIILLGNSND